MRSTVVVLSLVVVVAHALLTTACICYATSVTPHTLHKQANHCISFSLSLGLEFAPCVYRQSVALVATGSLSLPH
jgi:hypothetical protein